MASVRVSREQARRFLISRQAFRGYDSGLADRLGVEQVIRQLGAVQIDPINVFERNHHHALFSRVEGYRPEMLEHELYTKRSAFEYFANALCVLPMEDYPYFNFRMRQLQQEYVLEPTLAKAALHIVARLEAEGPLGSRHFDSGERISGFWDADGALSTKVEKQALDTLHYLGRVMISERSGMQRAYDLPGRIVPQELQAREVSREEYQRFMMQKFLRSFGLSQTGFFRFAWYDSDKTEKKRLLRDLINTGAVTEIEVEGVKRCYYVLSELLPQLRAAKGLEAERAVFVAPLDNLLWDRDRLSDIFEFDYRWEVYTPPAKRKYGYYVLPILFGDSFLGRIELKALRDKGQLNTVNMWLADPSPRVLAAVKNTIEEIAHYLGLRVGGRLC